jgi:hypothetical protein
MKAAPTGSTPSVQQHFEKRSPDVRAIYDRILASAEKLGPVREAPKKTSIHLERESAFAGVATRKDSLILTLKSATDIRSPRIVRREQASANRWHLEVRLETPAAVDHETHHDVAPKTQAAAFLHAGFVGCAKDIAVEIELAGPHLAREQ